jgi:pimeloyl-ACP methyl ester carboxylesterase
MHEHVIRRGDVNLHTVVWEPREEATEPPLFLLHGLSSNSYFWSRVAERLPWRRIVAIDQRAHGASSAPDDGYDPAELAADAAAVIEELELERPLVAGHSWGASIALQVAADRPDLVSALVVVDGPVRSFAERMTWEEAQKVMQPPLPVYGDVTEATAERKRWIGHVWGEDLDRFVAHGLVREGDGWRLPLTAPIRLQILHAMFSQPYAEQWTRVRCPVLLALAVGEGPGGTFYEFKKAGADAILAEHADVRLRWFETNHDIPVEDPDGLSVEIERMALRAGFRNLDDRVAGLGGDWEAPADESAYGEWTAKDLLAHLSSTQGTLPTMLTAAPPPADASREPFDPDRWNASMIRRRREQPPEALKAEFHAATLAVDAAVVEMGFGETVGIGRWDGREKSDAMRYMTHHQAGHLADLERALGGVPTA